MDETFGPRPLSEGALTPEEREAIATALDTYVSYVDDYSDDPARDRELLRSAMRKLGIPESEVPGLDGGGGTP
jgi:hypothetical protein